MPEEQTNASPIGFPIVSLDELRAVDILEPIKGDSKADCGDFEWAYLRAAEAARASGRHSAAKAFGLMAALCSLHFRPEDPAGPYGPGATGGGRRTAVPEDFRGEQSRILETFIADVGHAGLRGRIADVVWINDKSRTIAANAAIDAYCGTIEDLNRGIYCPGFDHPTRAMFEKIDLLRRSLQIAKQIGKKGELPDRVKMNSGVLYEMARRTADPVPFERLGRIFIAYRLAEPSAIARDARTVAAATADEPKFPLAVKQLWDLAADAYRDAKDEQSSRTCRLNGIELTLAMRGQVVRSAGAQASWIRTAIQELRNVSDTAQRREELQRELLQLQERALDEMHPIYTPIEVDDIQANTARTFGELTLSDALLRFAAMTNSRPVATLRAEALDRLNASPFFRLVNSVHTDHEGKYVAETSPGNDEPTQEAIKAEMSEQQRLWRHYLAAAYIDPARITIGCRHTITERHSLAITSRSPFIPRGHAYTYALGFARLMQGDFVSAGHLLIPQLEHSIRHVLRSHNVDSSKIMSDMLQEDRPLSALLEALRPEMEQIFTPDIVNEIDLLFVFRPGPALRHEFAHGKAGDGLCFSADVIYACWFIYRLACIPLFPEWKDIVAPAIDGGH